MALTIFGSNHKVTALEELERVSFTQDDVKRMISQLLSRPEIDEAVFVSTCNRIEWCTVCQEGFPIQQILRDEIMRAKPGCSERMFEHFYYREGNDAVVHLFSVVSGLDSLSLGENEIAGQLKHAYAVACDLKATGLLTNKLFHAAFRTSKRVKQETAVNEGNCSIGCVAVDLVQEFFPQLSTCRVLLIGAGNIGRVVAKTLKNRDVEQLWIANRDAQKAGRLAQEIGGANVLALSDILQNLDSMDVIISGTGSPDYVLPYAQTRDIFCKHPRKTMLMVDIALPRDIDPRLASLPQVTLKNLYDLKDVVEGNIQKRQQEVPKVQRIIDEEVQKFLSWQDSLKVTSTIKCLHQNFETIRQMELVKYQHQFAEDAYTQVEQFTKTLTNAYIHLIIANLKALNEICCLDAQQLHILEHLFDSQEQTYDEHARCRFKGQSTRAETDSGSDCASQRV